jgi:hypothetical protein
MNTAGTCHWNPSHSRPRGSRVKAPLVVTVTVLTTVDGAAVTVKLHVAVLLGTVSRVVGAFCWRLDAEAMDAESAEGEEADWGTVSVVPVTESATEEPVAEATTVGTETPEGVELTDTVLTAVDEAATEDAVFTVVEVTAVAETAVAELVAVAEPAPAEKSSTAETLRPFP